MAPSVLLVDSDSDSIAIYSLILRHHGYEVLSAPDGVLGFEIALQRRPDVVVSELFLPPSHDGSFLERLRADDRTSATPMIVLDSIPSFSDELFESDSRRTRLTKPCEPSRLLLEVERLLSPEMAVPPG